MANKNTRRAKQRGLTNGTELTIGTGESRRIEPEGRKARKVFRGECCDTRWNNPKSKKKGPKRFRTKKEIALLQLQQAA